MLQRGGGIPINDKNFPDENFRKYVIKEFDTDRNGTLSDDECNNVTEIWVSYLSISTLKGIENFKKLTTLNCSLNRLTSLDVSNNAALTKLECYDNQLTNLDLSKNKALTELDCSGNQLTSLGVSNNAALSVLNCSFNQLTSLDLSNNTALTKLLCHKNQLTSLDLSNNTALTKLYCYDNQLTSLDLSNNTALTELYCHTNKLKELNVGPSTKLTKLYCFKNLLTSLDVSNNAALTNLECWDNQLTSLDVSNNAALSWLYCSDNQLTSLDVSENKALATFDCSRNQLTSLDVSKNKALDYLLCYKNQLTSLDVSNNAALRILHCSSNQLTSLDLSKSTALYDLHCSDNQLTSLDVSKNTYLAELHCQNNPLTSAQLINKKYEEKRLIPVEYTVKVAPGSSKIPFSALPQGFDKKRIQGAVTGAQLGEDGFIWNKKPWIIQFKYKLCENPEEIVVADLEVKELEKILDVKDSNSPIPDDYVRLTFDATKDGKIKVNDGTTEGKEKVAIDVLKGTSYDDSDLTAKIGTIHAVPNDPTMTFAQWKDLPTDASLVKTQTYEAIYKKNWAGSMAVTAQPNKLSYTEGDKLDLSGLVVTITSNGELPTAAAHMSENDAALAVRSITRQPAKLSSSLGEKLGLTRLFASSNSNQDVAQDVTTVVAFKDFEKYGITATPANGTELKVDDNGKTITLTKKLGEKTLKAVTDALIVKQAPQVVGPKDPTKPDGNNPDTSKYWTVTFKSADDTKGTVDAKNTIYVLKSANKTLQDLKGSAPATIAKDGYKFDKWSPALDAAIAIDKNMTITANFVALDGVVGPKDPTKEDGKNPDTSKYWTVTFESEDTAKGTVDAKNTIYVLKSANKTLADLKDSAPATIAKDGYKFDKWSPALDAATAIDKNMTITANFVALDGVVGPKDPTKPDGKNPDTSKYWTVTFESEDSAKGTVAAKNTFYVLKTAKKTLADLKDSAPAPTPQEGYKFDKWEPALDNNTAIDKDMIVQAQFVALDGVVGPKDPTTPEGKNPDSSKYWTVTFKSADTAKGTVAAENTFYVLKSANKTLADLEKVAPATTAQEGYKFDKWEPALDNNTAIDKDMIVQAQFVALDGVVGPKDPTTPEGKNPDSSKYWTVTFKSADDTKGTVDAKNTFYVLKSANKTLADLEKVAPATTAKDGYKFDKWDPALDATVIANDVTIKACFKKADAPAPAPAPMPAPGSNNLQAATATAVPQTGDSANGLLYAALMGLPGVSLLAAGLRKRRKQH